jgi:hypothetical protein
MTKAYVRTIIMPVTFYYRWSKHFPGRLNFPGPIFSLLGKWCLIRNWDLEKASKAVLALAHVAGRTTLKDHFQSV